MHFYIFAPQSHFSVHWGSGYIPDTWPKTEFNQTWKYMENMCETTEREKPLSINIWQEMRWFNYFPAEKAAIVFWLAWKVYIFYTFIFFILYIYFFCNFVKFEEADKAAIKW